MKRLLSSRLFGDTCLVMASRLLGAGINYVTLALMARALGAHEFGIYLIAFSLAGILSLFCSLGFPAITARFVSEYKLNSRWDLFRGFVDTGRIGIFVAGVIFVPLLAAATTEFFAISTQYRTPLLIGCAAVPLLSLLKFNAAIANAFRLVLVSYLPDLILRPALFCIVIGGILVAGATLDASTALAWHVLVILLLVIAQAAALRYSAASRQQSQTRSFETRRWQRTAVPLLFVALFANFFADMETVILGALLPPDEVAIFNVCLKIALLIAFGIQVVDRLALPEISDAHAKGDRTAVDEAIWRANHFKFWPALLAAGLIAIFGEWILSVFGTEFRAGYAILLILVAAQVIAAAMGPVAQLLSLSDPKGAGATTITVSAIGLLLGNIVLVPLFGAIGAALTVAATSMAWTSVLAIRLNRELPYRLWIRLT